MKTSPAIERLYVRIDALSARIRDLQEKRSALVRRLMDVNGTAAILRAARAKP